MSTPSTSLDTARQQAFAGKVIGDMSSTLTTLLGVIGDRLGLFKALDEQGSLTAPELASRLQLNERYIREWLGGMAANGYVSYDVQTQRFTLPPEHAAFLAEEAGPMFVGGMYQMLPALAGVFDDVVDAFRRGGGVPQSRYGAGM